uniref:Uncharacterized protein n=1 Tax=Ditylenchus dipsaci TaxID=166011 RepID=A0A915EN29_9BILA
MLKHVYVDQPPVLEVPAPTAEQWHQQQQRQMDVSLEDDTSETVRELAIHLSDDDEVARCKQSSALIYKHLKWITLRLLVDGSPYVFKLCLSSGSKASLPYNHSKQQKKSVRNVSRESLHESTATRSNTSPAESSTDLPVGFPGTNAMLRKY